MFDARVPDQIIIGNGTVYVRRIGETEFRRMSPTFHYAKMQEEYEKATHGGFRPSFIYMDEGVEIDKEAYETLRQKYERMHDAHKAAYDEMFDIKAEAEIIYDEIEFPTDSEFFAAILRDVRPRMYAPTRVVLQAPSTYG